jgi:hypothetical protein
LTEREKLTAEELLWFIERADATKVGKAIERLQQSPAAAEKKRLTGFSRKHENAIPTARRAHESIYGFQHDGLLRRRQALPSSLS